MRPESEVLKHIMEIADAKGNIYVSKRQHKKYLRYPGSAYRILGLLRNFIKLYEGDVKDVEELGLGDFVEKLRQARHGDEYIELLSAIRRLFLKCSCNKTIICLNDVLPEDMSIPAIRSRLSNAEFKVIKSLGSKLNVYMLKKREK